jgi:hypothetical protein
MKNKLSLKTRKSLEVQLGEQAADEIYNLINSMSEEIANIKQNYLNSSVSSNLSQSTNVIQPVD